MDWLPRWIGKSYAKLWSQFHADLFLFDDAKRILQGKPALNIISELKQSQAVFIFDREGRKRIYRLVPPNLFIEALARQVDLAWLKQGTYANLLLLVWFTLLQHYGPQLASLAVFGSLSRNVARTDSDIDLLAVIDELPRGAGGRLRHLMQVMDTPEMQLETNFLNMKGVFPRLSFYAHRPSELQISPFTIDISFDLRVLYDQGALNPFLRQVQAAKLALNAERKPFGDGQYILDMHIPFGKVVDW